MPLPNYRHIDTVEGLEKFIAELEAEIKSAACSACRANKLNGAIRGAKRQIIFLRREQAKAEARAAVEEHPA